MPPGEIDKPHSVGRYLLFQEVAHGATATVHLARLRGYAGFARTVAIKRLLPSLAGNPELASMFVDEARLAARIRHPNVVSVLDVVAADGEPFVVMDYIHGEPLSHLIQVASRQRVSMPRRVLVTIMVGVLTGLEAAHEARDDRGMALELVHRSVSPQKVLLGLDGVPMVFDFGHAKALPAGSTRPGWTKRTLGYLSPEQLTTELVDRRTDIYAAGVMLWEGLTGRRLFDTRTMSEVEILAAKNDTRLPDPPSMVIASTPKALDEIVLKALSRSRDDRFKTAREMATALESALTIVPNRQVGEWVAQVAGAALEARAAEVSEIEGVELPASLAPAEFLSARVDPRRDVPAHDDAPPESEAGDGVSLLPAAATNPPRAGGLDLVALMPRLEPNLKISLDAPHPALPTEATEVALPSAPRRFGWGTAIVCAGLVIGTAWVIGSQLTAGPEPAEESTTVPGSPTPVTPSVPRVVPEETSAAGPEASSTTADR